MPLPVRIQLGGLQPNITRLSFFGQFTAETVESNIIEAVLAEALSQGQNKFIFDLTLVEHIDSIGVGIIAHFSLKVRQAGGAIRVVVSPGGRVQQAFVDGPVASYTTVTEACEGFSISGEPDQ